ncbi:MAG: hypothetical protein HRF49_03540 [bacterium]
MSSSSKGSQSNSVIKFGSDGYRGIIGDGFTFDILTRLCRALAKFLLERGSPLEIILGYDRRFMADSFAHYAAGYWESLGGIARVSEHPLSSPTLAWQTNHLGVSMGVMITASHNPPEYLGFKLKEPFGGSALPDVQARMSELASAEPPAYASFPPGYVHAKRFDPLEGYLQAIQAEFGALGNAFGSPGLLFDFMNGSAADIAPPALKKMRIAADFIRDNRDPLFGGQSPEPIPGKLTALRKSVISRGYQAGFAFDGDGDRLAVFDELGNPIGSHELFSLFLLHLANFRKESGRAVGTISFSRIVDRVASSVGMPLLKVPVGFKHLSAEFASGGVAIGGEESGGCGFGFWLPERDALVMALLLLEIMKETGKPLSALRSDLQTEFGPLHFRRSDVPFGEVGGYDRLASNLRGRNSFGGLEIENLQIQDGLMFNLANDSWILFRLSGTEPVARVYAESPDESAAEALIADAASLLAAMQY